MSEECRLVIGETAYTGWTAVRVNRGVERMVGDFEISMTQRSPGIGLQDVAPGDFCQVLLGDDEVITGYVDEFIPTIAAREHSIKVAGRSRTQDLVDCSAVWPGSQLPNGTLLEIAQKLAKPFSISAYSIGGDIGPRVPFTVLGWGDTPFDILEPLARLRAKLMYDDPSGNLVFADCGTERAAGALVEGQNVETASLAYSMRGRYSNWRLFRVKLSGFADRGNERNYAADFPDPTVTRYRPKFLVAEAADGGIDVATKRAAWSLARSIGRSAAVHVVTDSWRDQAGALWKPNSLLQIKLPSLGLASVQWLISEVSYTRDAGGTHAHLTLMHPDSFKPQPINYQPVPRPLREEIEKALPEVGK